MQRKASAVWKGGLKDGKGAVSAGSGVLANTPYSFVTRFENTPGTNPEELIAAAHAACFSMALSAQLGGANLTPASISTTATLTLEKLDSGWTITAVHLDVVGKVPGADAAVSRKLPQTPRPAAQSPRSSTPKSPWTQRSKGSLTHVGWTLLSAAVGVGLVCPAPKRNLTRSCSGRSVRSTH